MKPLSQCVADTEDDSKVRQAAAEALGRIGDASAVKPLSQCVADTEDDSKVRQAAAEALGQIGGASALQVLKRTLRDDGSNVRRACLGGLAAARENEANKKLLSQDIDGVAPWLDPRETITRSRMHRAAESLGMKISEVRRRYKALQAKYGLKLE